MKKIHVYLFVIFTFLVSCENPFVGVGNSVDTVAPQVRGVTPADFTYVRDDFNLIVTCYDNVLVTKAKLEIEKDNVNFFEKTEKVSREKNDDGSQTWKVPLKLKEDLKIGEKEQCELKITVYVYDERENLSENSYKSVTIIVDRKESDADIYSPELFKYTEEEFEKRRGEEINSENFTVFQNSTFYISGECNDDLSIQSVMLTLKDEKGEIVEKIDIDKAKKEGYASGSLYNWKLSLSAIGSASELAIPLNVPIVTDTYFYEVFLQVKDGAENVAFKEEEGYEETLGKSFGWFAVRQTADYPFSDFSSINDEVSNNSVLTGKSYDDDGIALIKIYCQSSDSNNWELIKSYSANGENADESLGGTPQIFTWNVPTPENSTASSYRLKVEVTDIHGVSNIDGYEKNYLPEDKIFCSFKIVDPTAPSIASVDLSDFRTVVDKDGMLTINVNASDNSAVKKIYVAWKPERTDAKALPKWDEFASKAVNKYTDGNGIKYWNISPTKPAREVKEKLQLNIYSDFEGEYDKKLFYVYAEDDSGKFTVITSQMPKFTEMPEIGFTSPTENGAVETTHGGQQFNITAKVVSYVKVKKMKISADNNESLSQIWTDNANTTYDEENECFEYTVSSNWWGNDEGEGSHSLTAEVTDIFGNVNVDTLSFEIDNGVPRIKSVYADADPGSYCAGATIDIYVEMKKEVTIEDATADNLTLTLSNGQTASYNADLTNKNKSGEGIRKIYFTYTVGENDTDGPLDVTHLNLNNVKIYDEVGNIEDLRSDTTRGEAITKNISIAPEISLEKNFSSMLKIDNTPPKIKSITSTTPNGSYTFGSDPIELVVEFDEEVQVKGKPILQLSNNQTAIYEKIENGTKLYFKYTVSKDIDIDALEWQELAGDNGTGIADCAKKDGNAFKGATYDKDGVSLAKSGHAIKIDNTPPKAIDSKRTYTDSEGLKFTVIFDEPVFKVPGKKAVLKRDSSAAPIVLSVEKYNEYVALVPDIAEYYEKGVNGADDSFKVDNTTKYILKYNYDETNGNLLNLFQDEKLGFYTEEIMMESNWVTSSDSSIVITIPSSALLTGETYTLEIDDGFAEDQVGLRYSSKYSFGSEKAGTKAQPPIIRIDKKTSATAKTTTMKINTITQGAQITYTINSTTATSTGVVSVKLGTEDDNGATYTIKATAKVNNGTESDAGYEVAYKTVISTEKNDKGSNDIIFFRGSNVAIGNATVPNFPFSWDETNTPEVSVNDYSTHEKEFAAAGMIKATTTSPYTVISWGVNDQLYFFPLSCKDVNNKIVWAWEAGGSLGPDFVEAGGKKSFDRTGRNKFEENYHDKYGNNYQ
ncbi:MAG: hypothetical protein J1G30_07770 [Spirochaetales bacterium]|nr:hypothetical protein [Spirochaetales bacterium]